MKPISLCWLISSPQDVRLFGVGDSLKTDEFV